MKSIGIVIVATRYSMCRHCGKGIGIGQLVAKIIGMTGLYGSWVHVSCFEGWFKA